MNKIDVILNQMEAAIPSQSLEDPNISAGSIGWHIEHSLLTIGRVIQSVKRSNPKDYKWTFNLPRLIIFATGTIPKGKAKAPSVVQPKENFDEASLREHLAKVKSQLIEFQSLDKNHYFEHPFFKNLNIPATKKFFEIHTNHHLKIIHELVNSKP